jgi:hypothetical protein
VVLVAGGGGLLLARLQPAAGASGAAASILDLYILSFDNNSKLKKEDVLFIRESKLKLKELSLKFGICESTVSKVRLIRTYKNI